MAVTVLLERLGSRPAFRSPRDVDLQSRSPEHGLGRIYAKTAVDQGRLVSTSEPHGKRGDYRITHRSRTSSTRRRRAFKKGLLDLLDPSVPFHNKVPGRDASTRIFDMNSWFTSEQGSNFVASERHRLN